MKIKIKDGDVMVNTSRSFDEVEGVYVYGFHSVDRYGKKNGYVEVPLSSTKNVQKFIKQMNAIFLTVRGSSRNVAKTIYFDMKP